MNLFSKVKDLTNDVMDKGKEIGSDSLNKAKETLKKTNKTDSSILKDTVINVGIEIVTKPFNDSMDQRRNSADSLLDTVTTKSGEISKNMNLKGFIFEQEQARTFNELAAKEGSSLRAIVDPPTGIDGKGAPDIRIIDTATGETLKNYQAKIGSEQYINNQLKEEKYQDGNTDAFVTDIDNSFAQNMRNFEQLQNELSNIEFDEKYLENSSIILDKFEQSQNVESQISFNEISAEAFSVEQMQEISLNPIEFIDELHYSANSEEIIDGAMSGAVIGAVFQSIQESIKILAKLYKGENIPKEVVMEALNNVMITVTSSALRGTLIKIIEIILEKQMEDSGSLPLVIVSVAPIVYKTLLEYFKGEITLQECINKVGVEALSRAMIITISITFPPIGFALMGTSIIFAIWKEFDLEKEILDKYPEVEKVFILVNKMEERKSYLVNNSKIKFDEFRINTIHSVRDTKELVKNSFVENVIKLNKNQE